MSRLCLQGRVVVLTGGGGLLGRSHAQALSRAGAHVVVADIDECRANNVAESLEGAQGMPVKVDVTSQESVVQMVDRVMERFDRIDALVNNAAMDFKFDPAHAGEHIDSFEQYPLELWHRSLDVNLTGAFICTRATAPFLLSSGNGSVVNIASIYGLVGPDQRLYQRESERTRYKPVDYSATKKTLLALTRYLAAYWAGRGIRVNTLTLGGVADHAAEFVRRYSDRVQIGRMATRDEYNGALVFLLSDASSYMTGANLIVDGGWSMVVDALNVLAIVPARGGSKRIR